MADDEGFEPPRDLRHLLVFKTSPFSQTWVIIRINGGAKGDRTPDLLRARQALSQLSYGPIKWSGRQDLNLRPPGPKPGALPSCATSRIIIYLVDPVGLEPTTNRL